MVMRDAPVRIGFLGTGLIGAPMVERLLDRGLDVAVWNRTVTKLVPLVERGAGAAASARALAEQSDVVCVCLTDTAAVQDVLFGETGMAAGMREGQLLIDFSSIAPDATVEMAARLRREAGAHWIDAPVSGGLPAARAGTLIIFAGGDAADIARAAPVFDALSTRVTHMGGQGAGQLTKSCNQMIVGCNLVVIAEMLAFARVADIEVGSLPAALAGGFADSLPLQIFGTRMARDIDTPRIGALATFRKDIAQVVRLAAERGASIPMTRAAAALLADAAASDAVGADADMSRLIKLFDARNTAAHAPKPEST